MSTSLTQLITDEHVVLGARPQSWQDAIRLAAAPLVASASVTDHYIDRMIEVVQAYGPYIVLAPGVALAHAQPDGSVTRTAMSAMTVPEGSPSATTGTTRCAWRCASPPPNPPNTQRYLRRSCKT